MSRDRVHAGRIEVLKIFEEWFSSFLQAESRCMSIAIVGGDSEEIELEIFKQLNFGHKFSFLGIGENDIHFDLNVKKRADSNLKEQFDLVICCQVLEHIWNMENAVSNLSELVKPSGLIWINVPTSNLKHGSPEFYSSGYQPELVEKMFETKNFVKIISGDLGSKRLYKITHKQQFWPSALEHQKPFLRGIHNKRHLFPLKFIKYFFWNLEALTWSPKFRKGTAFSTETYYLGRKSSGRA